MPIDYFSKCKTSSNKNKFGLCDDENPASAPAYIDENNSLKWIGVVNNPNEKNINFNAIDNCIDIRRDDNTIDKRCDGVLSYEQSLIFVELKKRKDRKGNKWFKEGREQLTATIKRFKQEVDIDSFDNVKAYVCNSLRPQAYVGQAVNIQKFKDDTGFILYGKQAIDIE